MQLILTHEQADFDALAALYAASLLDNGIPVLPRQANRNVRAFITLYGSDFPFVDPRDLPQGPVECVTLVDTQSLITLKGMSKDTLVNVFDHHPARNPTKSLAASAFPQRWQLTIVDLGAVTTYFVEILRERGEVPGPIGSTLLLLGIYEDTGNLTYSRTTPRDVYAAGWLMEQGAQLAIVNEFLNPPLSNEQRKVYDQLVESIETLDINGHRILLACAQAEKLTEEISLLAHKLRDLFDPDALFVLVHNAEGIRLVARSSTDLVDVSLIAAHFGGGGHNRAAAALIKKGPSAGKEESPISLTSVRSELITILSENVRPVVTVSQLMSKRPRIIPAVFSAPEALKLMIRYGYEGFPVEKDGKIVGLLTRRAVDRAVSHQLNISAASLMEAGQVFVHPSDSLQRLQNVMAESGWGQVPVIDPETGKVVGIVTRTDVLKILSLRYSTLPRFHSLTGKLREKISPPQLELIRVVSEEAARQHLALYMVGGFVRDLILDRPGADFDMVVEGDAISLGNGLVSRFGGKLTTHARFGTAKWYLRGSSLSTATLPAFLDLISARQEFYEHPTALPSVENGSIKLDLHRRDFTINTLALRLDGRHFGELHDYYGGLADLEKHVLRVLHSLSFVDDPTRMLRAVRYEQRYDFQIEERTLQLIAEALPLIAHLTGERVRHELDLVVIEPNVVAMLARLDELGLLRAIALPLPWSPLVGKRIELVLENLTPSAEWGFAGSPVDHSILRELVYCAWFLDLPIDLLEALHKRLNFQMSTLKAVQASARLYAGLPALHDAPPSEWVDRLDGLPLLSIYVVYLVTREIHLQTYVNNWRNIRPQTTGDALIDLGLKPGPHFQVVLHTLRSAWLDGRLSTIEQEQKLLQELLKDL